MLGEALCKVQACKQETKGDDSGLTADTCPRCAPRLHVAPLSWKHDLRLSIASEARMVLLLLFTSILFVAVDLFQALKFATSVSYVIRKQQQFYLQSWPRHLHAYSGSEVTAAAI